ncbi:MAG: DUF192 domain-containing protein [Dissulfurispiraceae bacterium]
MSSDSRCTIIPGDIARRTRQQLQSLGTIRYPTFTIELAITQEQHYRGLSYRPFIPVGHGMLFIYSEPQILTFCMRHCFISLDIAFIGSDMRIVGLATMLVETYGQETLKYSSPVPAQYALELNAGELLNCGVLEGDIVVFSGDLQDALMV